MVKVRVGLLVYGSWRRVCVLLCEEDRWRYMRPVRIGPVSLNPDGEKIYDGGEAYETQASEERR